MIGCTVHALLCFGNCGEVSRTASAVNAPRKAKGKAISMDQLGRMIVVHIFQAALYA
jgi:hypothetical protein